MSRNTENVSCRMLFIEEKAIKDACAAWKSTLKISPSQLIATAALGEAQALGFRPETYEDRPIRVPMKWTWAPERGGESMHARTTVTMQPIYLRSIQQAAEAVNVPLNDFLIGSTLRFIRSRQKMELKNKELQKVVLPEKYRD